MLSEFTGAVHELHQALVCNPHDIEGLKKTIMRAIETPDKEKRRLMRAMRRRVADHDVQRWAARFLEALAVAPERPQRSTKEQTADDEHARADQRARELHHARAAKAAGAKATLR